MFESKNELLNSRLLCLLLRTLLHILYYKRWFEIACIGRVMVEWKNGVHLIIFLEMSLLQVHYQVRNTHYSFTRARRRHDKIALSLSLSLLPRQRALYYNESIVYYTMEIKYINARSRVLSIHFHSQHDFAVRKLTTKHRAGGGRFHIILL